MGCRFFSGHFWLILVDYYDFYCLFSGFSGGHFTCFFQSFTIKECLEERGRWSVAGVAFRDSTKKLYSEDLSGILRLGFQQNPIFQDFIGHLAFGLPTGFNFQGS